MDNIPEELWCHAILPYLSLFELCTIRRVSKSFDVRLKEYMSCMKSLDMRQYYNIIDEQGFTHILRNLKNLTYINVSKCWNIVNEYNMELLARHCKDIQIFIANGCGNVTDDMVYIIARECPNIRYMSINKCYKITHRSLDYIAEYLPDIEELHVANNYGVKDESIVAISKSCKKLTKLDLGGCVIRGCSLDGFLSDESTNLKEIRLTKCRYVSSHVMEKIVNKGIIVNTCF